MDGFDQPAPERHPLLERFKYVIFVVIAAAIALGVAVLLWRRSEPTTITVIPPAPTAIPEPTLPPSVTPTPGPYMVYVTGAVVQPEVIVTLEYGSRVLHAIQAAGGAADNADLERVNLAQVLQDGDQVHVPAREPDGENPAPGVTVPQIVTATPGACTVYVVGEVLQPETMITLPCLSRVQDAIDQAGGATGSADLSRVNLGQILNDGDLVYVPPLVGEGIKTPTPNHLLLIHINYAVKEELEALPGIGPSLAQAIIDYRTEHGPFTSLEELDNIPGIGAAKINALRDQVIVD